MTPRHDPECNPALVDDRLARLEKALDAVYEIRERLTIIETKIGSALWAARAAGAVGGAAMTLLGLAVAWLKK